MAEKLTPALIDEAMTAAKNSDGCAFKGVAGQLDPWDRVELLKELGYRGGTETERRKFDPSLGFAVDWTISYGSSAWMRLAGRDKIIYELKIQNGIVSEKPDCNIAQRKNKTNPHA